jgi:small-conductance mechanosensitive channel
MSYSIIFVALVTAFLLTLLFSKSFRNKGPFGGLLLFFLIIFLSTWSGQLWIHPVTKPIFGVDWGLLIFTAIVFSVMMMALSAPASKSMPHEKPVNQEAGIAIGLFFWILIILLIVAVASGYYKGIPFQAAPPISDLIE